MRICVIRSFVITNCRCIAKCYVLCDKTSNRIARKTEVNLKCLVQSLFPNFYDDKIHQTCEINYVVVTVDERIW